ncbi:MAG TPA: hypothetical protein VMH22_03035 [bacterium]|nr:hypothetical protein [bacterium]
MGPAPHAVKRLVDQIDQNRKVFLSPDYKEEQLRATFPNGPVCQFVNRTSSLELALTPSSPRSVET